MLFWPWAEDMQAAPGFKNRDKLEAGAPPEPHTGSDSCSNQKLIQHSRSEISDPEAAMAMCRPKYTV